MFERRRNLKEEKELKVKEKKRNNFYFLFALFKNKRKIL